MPPYVTGYSSTDLAKIQTDNPEVGTVIKWMVSGDERPSRVTVTSHSPYTRH